MRLILFDCDGTLADSFGMICATMRRAFAVHGLPEPADEATRAIIGLSLEEAMRRLHPTADGLVHAALAAGYREVFHRARADPGFRETLFEGIKPLLASLAARDDVLLGVVTGKSRRGVVSIVDAHGLHGHFLAVRTADDCPSKPHPAMVLECCAELGVEPAETIVVGDAVYDMAMARAAGAEAIGVTWGASSADALRTAGATVIAENVAELARILEAWIAGASMASRTGASQEVAVRAS